MKRTLYFLIFTLHFQYGLAQVWSPNANKIAFFYMHAVEDIYTVNGDGSNFQVIESHPKRDFAPRWSPDSQYIIFTSVRDGHHELYRIDAEGKNLKKLTEGNFDSEDGDYSPDGKRIVFASNRTGNNELYIMDSDGGNIKQLTVSLSQEGTPRWSPDGHKILFRSSPTLESPSNLYTLDLNNLEFEQLTNSTEGEFHQSWSADGSKICFVKVVNGVFQIHTMSSRGGKSKILVNDKRYQTFYPNWSPNGKHIAFTRDVVEGNQEGLPALFLVDLKGKLELLSKENSF